MAGTTNLQQWNPTAANQETDAEYTADSQRAGGATYTSIFQSPLANKAFFQWSTYLAALFQAFAAKGFTTSDSNLNTLAAQCANFLTTADLLAVISANGGPLIRAEQFGPSYGSTPNTAAISAMTQGGATINWLFSAINAANTVTFSVRADGLLTATAVDVTGELTAGSITLSAPGTAGQVLTNVGGLFLPMSIPVPTVAVNFLSGSRAFGAVYQNTYGGVLLVNGHGVTGGGSVGSVAAYIGSGSASNLVFANTVGATVNGGACGFSFTVPSGWYYAVQANTLTNGQGTAVGAVGSWAESVIT